MIQIFFLCTCKVSIKKNKYAYNNLSSQIYFYIVFLYRYSLSINNNNCVLFNKQKIFQIKCFSNIFLKVDLPISIYNLNSMLECQFMNRFASFVKNRRNRHRPGWRGLTPYTQHQDANKYFKQQHSLHKKLNINRCCFLNHSNKKLISCTFIFET